MEENRKRDIKQDIKKERKELFGNFKVYFKLENLFRRGIVEKYAGPIWAVICLEVITMPVISLLAKTFDAYINGDNLLMLFYIIYLIPFAIIFIMYSREYDSVRPGHILELDFISKLCENSKIYGIIPDSDEYVMADSVDRTEELLEDADISFFASTLFEGPYMAGTPEYIYSRDTDVLEFRPVIIRKDMIESVALYRKLLFRPGMISLYRCARIHIIDDGGKKHTLKRIVCKEWTYLRRKDDVKAMFSGLRQGECKPNDKKPKFVLGWFI